METNRIYQGDVLEGLMLLPSDSIDLCVSSPPYWGKRNYGVSGQLGLEPDHNDYIEKIVRIAAEIKRVLKPTGSFYLNLADTRNSPKKGNTNGTGKGTVKQKAGLNAITFYKPLQKDYPLHSLLGIPTRIKDRIVKDLQFPCINDIIWHKPNAQPEGNKRQYTTDYEFLFFFVKDQKKAYFETQYEPYKETSKKRIIKNSNPKGWERGNLDNWKPDKKGRLKRAVWQIGKSNFHGAHFAVFPEALIETPIKASCPEGGTVLDPFMGSGTSAVVALKQNKNFVGIELNPKYIRIAEQRIAPFYPEIITPILP